MFPKKHFFEVKKTCGEVIERKTANQEKRSIIAEVYILANLIIVAPATNAISERSFSALKWIKSYIRSTMHSNRLNHAMILHVRKSDDMSLKEIGNEFISQKEKICATTFGKFSLCL